jgi:hypothetical protein
VDERPAADRLALPSKSVFIIKNTNIFDVYSLLAARII